MFFLGVGILYIGAALVYSGISQLLKGEEGWGFLQSLGVEGAGPSDFDIEAIWGGGNGKKLGKDDKKLLTPHPGQNIANVGGIPIAGIPGDALNVVGDLLGKIF